ncbi:peptidoglycan DD-metalloendopeptidase family protein [Paenibacillus sp. OAS669]|uniref:peptidoglycan DD-metalloendopeptidase family protein n=1 Tax=Paenibacillus sp. OAS669 TaxID=2663821 RepID=UPI0017897353|nr:peptidoglycan DD-metalloendopeptidase family protein [Paenibacillus sp. OAS669]MBE1443874.1 murein DD-endopeptidase MepM/ murein hydrolase activator NlpD [Paenibacillus sp. OAS669]
MTVFRGMSWIKEKLDKSRQKLSSIQLRNLTATTRVEPTTEQQIELSDNHTVNQNPFLHKWMLVKTISVLGVVSAMVWGGNAYVQAGLKNVYHVSIDGQDVGVVENTTEVEEVKQTKAKELTNNSFVRMKVKEPEVTFQVEKAFMPSTNDQEVLEKVSEAITAYPVGTEIVVDGNPMGVLKDEQTADQMLEDIKNSALEKKKESGKVRVLSASPSTPAAEVELQKVEFVQKVELKEIQIQPQDVMSPDELKKKLETGDVQPTKYTVEKGDCVSCIAKKLDIPKQVIYQNNPTISDDMIKVGQQLDLTVLQPKLAVRTVEKIVESQEIQYDTEYQTDDSMRAGTSEVIKQGKNGMKKVMIQVTKVNGLMTDETVLSEEVVQEPVKAVVRKGTKVIKGEGTGKFAWPVVSSTITSTFGTRWGVFHKGVDLTSPNKNILASDNGKVIFAGVKSGYGNCVIIDHMNGYKTLYGHLSQIYTSTGKIVEKGEKIGYMGSTGDSTGVHLHFEVQQSDSPQNPLKYLSR